MFQLYVLPTSGEAKNEGTSTTRNKVKYDIPGTSHVAFCTGATNTAEGRYVLDAEQHVSALCDVDVYTSRCPGGGREAPACFPKSFRFFSFTVHLHARPR